MKLKAIILLLISSSVFAADFSTSPTAPVVPNLISVTPNEASIMNDATSNKVYIDQSGQNVDVNITQTGSGNYLGTGLTSSAIYMRGDNQKLVSIQTGNNNGVKGWFVSGTGNGADATVTIRQIGNSNLIEAHCGDGSLSNCNKLDVNWKFTGNSNELKFNGSGTNITSQIETIGNGNKFYIDALSNKDTQLLTVTGDNNTFNAKQTGGSTNGQSLAVNLQGTGNSITTLQEGTVDTLININSVGSNGTFNIKTGN